MPDAWRVTVKINDSGDDNILIRGAGKIAFDQRGYARVTKNTFQDTPCSSNCNLVFNPVTNRSMVSFTTLMDSATTLSAITR